jgi:uncharacterized protein YndB with AHSA1/START domain
MYSCSVDVVVDASREAVWEALTSPDQVEKYFFGTRLSTDWQVGSPLTFRGEWKGQAYEDRGTVLAFDPPRSLSFNYWSSFSTIEDTPDNRQILRYELEEAETGVRVTLHQSNIDTQEHADHSAQNWKMVLDGLKKFVESGN